MTGQQEKATVKQLLLTVVFEGVVEFVDFFGCTPVTSALD